MGRHADQLTFALEAHVEHVRAPADDLAPLVQPGGQRPWLRACRDLLDPAEQRQMGAIDIAPPVLNWSR